MAAALPSCLLRAVLAQVLLLLLLVAVKSKEVKANTDAQDQVALYRSAGPVVMKR